MFCGLGEEERTKIREKKGKKGKKRKKKGNRKEKKEKKEKKRNKPHRSQKWVGWDERYLETYNPTKYFLPYLSRF